jgi:hypothetical protein
VAKFTLKKLAKNLQRNDILVPHIDLYQSKGEFPDVWNIEIRNTKAPDPYFHPSGDCFTDPVTLYLEKSGQGRASRTIDYGLRRVFDCGHFWHGYYQNILVEMGFVEPNNVEKPVTYERVGRDTGFELLWTGRGTIDLFDVKIPGQPHSYIVDLKTMGDEEFDNGPRPETFKKWEAQLNCYMDWTGLHHGFILGVRKGGTRGPAGRPQHDLKEFRVAYQPALLSDIYRRWEQAQRYLDGVDEVPSID